MILAFVMEVLWKPKKRRGKKMAGLLKRKKASPTKSMRIGWISIAIFKLLEFSEQRRRWFCEALEKR